ncbi:MAG TPA: hypothetical protein VNZ94_18205 [Xanthobacteraceae bacterium]|nr:hypothetical protein [Xanthobacteraceae bacterium]
MNSPDNQISPVSLSRLFFLRSTEFVVVVSLETSWNRFVRRTLREYAAKHLADATAKLIVPGRTASFSTIWQTQEGRFFASPREVLQENRGPIE